MKTLTVCEILNRFKDLCSGRGWKTSEFEDWVEIDNRYHNLLWGRDVPPSSFKKITSDRKCVIREGLSYRVVKASYTAWLFCKVPSEALLKTFLEDPEYSSKTALYDLSPMLAGKNLCLKLNSTDSPVFKEFEGFLRNELKINLEPFPSFSEPRTSPNDCTIAELA
jgi:hypothetical protein